MDFKGFSRAINFLAIEFFKDREDPKDKLKKPKFFKPPKKKKSNEDIQDLLNRSEVKVAKKKGKKDKKKKRIKIKKEGKIKIKYNKKQNKRKE
jgi:hypothetical protein